MTSPKSASLTHIQSVFKTCVPRGQLERLVNRSEFKIRFVSVRPSFLVPHTSGWFHHHPSLPWPETFPRPFSSLHLLHSLWTLCRAISLFTIGSISSPLSRCCCPNADPQLLMCGLLFSFSLFSHPVFSSQAELSKMWVWLHYSCLCKMLMWLFTLFKSTSSTFLAWYTQPFMSWILLFYFVIASSPLPFFPIPGASSHFTRVVYYCAVLVVSCRRNFLMFLHASQLTPLPEWRLIILKQRRCPLLQKGLPNDPLLWIWVKCLSCAFFKAMCSWLTCTPPSPLPSPSQR